MRAWECRCKCHTDPEHIKHCMPCCSKCLLCGGNVMFGFEEEHKKDCFGLYSGSYVLIDKICKEKSND